MAHKFKFPAWALADEQEKVFIHFAEGKGEVRLDGKGLSVKLDLTTPDGKAVGTQICSGEVRGARSVKDLIKVPANPDVTFGDPGPIREVRVTAICQSTWTFNDGSTLTAIGKGTSQIIPLASGTVVVKDRAALIITNGTGVYEGARGSVDINSTVSAIDLDEIPFGKPGTGLLQKSIELFRVFLAEAVE
ncbi:MAG TPA: hypothetical protein VN643_18340 [Pyrinomonadaceae bacterium]|nr:hypothetical protein [Pyrinomonadaceae bacterium]